MNVKFFVAPVLIKKTMPDDCYYREEIRRKREATNTAGSSAPVSAFVACFFRTYGFPLMTALMLMLMMFIVMRVLVGMFFC